MSETTTISISDSFFGSIPKNLLSQVDSTLKKLRANREMAGLHVEPIHQAADDRIRSIRVTRQYRILAFELSRAGDPFWLVEGVYDHDDAYRVARSLYLRVNPVSGSTEIRDDAEALRTDGGGGYSESELQRRAAELAAEQIAEREAREAAQREQEEREAEDGSTEATPEAPAPTPTGPSGPVLTVSAQELEEELGIDHALARAAAEADEDQLLELADSAPGWQGKALLDLATGTSLADVRAAYFTGAGGGTAVGTPSSTEDLVRSMGSDASRATFHLIKDDKALEKILALGGLPAVASVPPPRAADLRRRAHPRALPTHGRGRDREDRRPRPPSGAPGPGVARAGPDPAHCPDHLHPQPRRRARDPRACPGRRRRAHRRAGEPGDAHRERGPDRPQPGGRASRDRGTHGAGARMGHPPARPDALRRHGLADGPRRGRGGPRRDPPLGGLPRRRVPGGGAPAPDHRRDRVSPGGPGGRGTRLGRNQRRAVWKVIARYRENGMRDEQIDWDELSAVAAAVLDTRAEETGERPADHVLVDEGQDLRPPQWQMLRALVAEGEDDMFIAEDSHQRIYTNPVRLGRYGIRITGRSRRLKLNYRTTAQNLDFAVRVLDGGDFDLGSMDEETIGAAGGGSFRSARSGPEPLPIHAEDLTDELEKTATQLRTWLDELHEADMDPSAIGLLTRWAKTRDLLVRAMGERGLTVANIDRNAERTGAPLAMTFHRAKGMEFSKVLLFEVDAGSVRRPQPGQAYDEQAASIAELQERSLLYVGASRARDELVYTWTKAASPFLHVD